MQGIRPRNLTLKGDLNIRNIGRSIDRIAGAITAGVPVRIDASAVTTIDVAALQALVSAHRTARSRGVPLEIRVPEGGGLARGLAECGLSGPSDPAAKIAGELWTGIRHPDAKAA